MRSENVLGQHEPWKFIVLIHSLISESPAEKERQEIEVAIKERYVANHGFIKEKSDLWVFTSGDGT